MNKKRILASLLILLAALLALLVVVTAVLVRVPARRRGPHAPAPVVRVTGPPAAIPSVRVRSVAPLPGWQTAVREARRCLNALCETGASDDSVARTRGLVARLDATPRPFAKRLSAVLAAVLACGDRGREIPVGVPASSFPGLPHDLTDRAAAACDARERRRPGDIVFSFAGDCTFGTVNGDDGPARFPTVYRRSGRVDYPFALMRPWFLNDDLTVVNFECTLTDAARTADKQWHFKGPAQYASIFPAGSVEAVTLANNHSHDYLDAGFRDTVSNFRRAHVPVFYQNTPYITRIRGVPVVLIGDCTVVGENTTQIDGAPEQVLRQIRRYKTPGSIVIVVMHWGGELETIPRPWQQALGRRFIDAGADAVVGHHPHVVQGIERYRGRYIAYSLGNFAFGGNSLARFPETFVLRLRFRATGGRVGPAEAVVVPCWITSTRARNPAGVLRNDYQPKPVFGPTAERTVALVLARSARLEYGVKRLTYLRLR